MLQGKRVGMKVGELDWTSFHRMMMSRESRAKVAFMRSLAVGAAGWTEPYESAYVQIEVDTRFAHLRDEDAIGMMGYTGGEMIDWCLDG